MRKKIRMDGRERMTKGDSGRMVRGLGEVIEELKVDLNGTP